MSRLSARELSVAPPAETATPEPILRGFSLELEPGRWIAIGGPNGCGKTTLLRVLAGLWPARSGTLLLEGAPFGPGVPRERVAVILQDPSCQLLQPTVREELAFGARNLGVPEEETGRRVARWAARLGLGAELDRDPQVLSAGRQQLVLIAAALVAEPAILLADEPAAHLDPAARGLVLAAIRERVGEGLSVLWATQDPAERAAADRAVHLGGEAPAPVPSADHGEAPGGGPLVDLVVAPDEGGDGPRVRTPVPLRLPLAKTGVACLEGPNGSGKSVLLAAAVSLLETPQVRLEWHARRDPPPILASQYPETEIFEEFVGDEVAYAAVSREVARNDALREAAVLADRLGLGGAAFLRRRVWSLSGGEKRLVSIVGALLAPASLLALDEPTAGLDPVRRGKLLAIVGEIARTRSVLVASQDRAWLEGLGGSRVGLGSRSVGAGPSGGRKTD